MAVRSSAISTALSRLVDTSTPVAAAVNPDAALIPWPNGASGSMDRLTAVCRKSNFHVIALSIGMRATTNEVVPAAHAPGRE
jgi:hypothetical protein